MHSVKWAVKNFTRCFSYQNVCRRSAFCLIKTSCQRRVFCGNIHFKNWISSQRFNKKTNALGKLSFMKYQFFRESSFLTPKQIAALLDKCDTLKSYEKSVDKEKSNNENLIQFDMKGHLNLNCFISRPAEDLSEEDVKRKISSTNLSSREVSESSKKTKYEDDIDTSCNKEDRDISSNTKSNSFIKIDIKGQIDLSCFLTEVSQRLLSIQDKETYTCTEPGITTKPRKSSNKQLDSKFSSKSEEETRTASNFSEQVCLEQIGPHEYQVDCDGYVICFTDGSCSNNGRKNAAAGFGVFFEEDHPLNASKPVVGRTTNNTAEIQAAIHAIKTAKKQGIKKLCINTDSKFLVNSMTSWINAWKLNGWCLKNGNPVKNQDDFKILDGLLGGDMTVKWNYVKGHKGIRGNEMADKLAKKGTEIYKRMHKIKC